MKYTDIDKFLEENNLLLNVEEKAGIYAITVDNQIVYIGQSKKMRERCKQHIYNTENAMLNMEKKYLLLLSAKLGEHNIDCITLEICQENELRDREDWWIDTEAPILNIATPTGRHDISGLKIDDLLAEVDKRHKKILNI